VVFREFNLKEMPNFDVHLWAERLKKGSVKISGNSSSLSNIGVGSPKCGRFSHFSLWFTDSQPNNGAFFQYL